MTTLKEAVEAQTSEIKKHTEMLRDQMFKIEVEVMEGGKLPCKAHKTDAGFDVFATENVTIYPGCLTKHPLNFRMKLPKGTWARLETKSGLGSKGMLVYAGVIDETYRGVVQVLATNLKTSNLVEDESYVDEGSGYTMHPSAVIDNCEPILIKKGEKLAQFTMNPHSNEFFVVQVDSVSTDTDRGNGGFGSTGA